ncbi:hypothetical protein C6N75_00635 [Streptomyces solincola]|uniref:Uncharacterized protein n=1 Tax=Streptomyces solincola TaxID=2100817 RepID=A0A2S9Q328_9ACTN|nr:hypothetical protein [Streptomyces solincola]PRH81085.1 hypothetical protein C6N75_00635 [Streptomyces solincola]
MNGRGYSPQGHRPEPTTAPPTPGPGTPAADRPVDAYADMSAQLGALHTFLKARAAETPVVDPLFHEALGYALGYADACMEKRDIVGAVRKLEWMRNEAQRWADHPDFPAEARR